MIEARSYQVEAVASIWKYFLENKGNPVVAMPTGTGKSIVIAMFLKSVYDRYPNQRIMILTHVKELLVQNYEKLKSLWPFAPAGVYSAGLNKRDMFSPITFAGIASVAKKAPLFGRVDLVLIDEAHLVSPNQATMYQKFIDDLKKKNPYLKVIGLTATPWRLGHGKLIDPVVDKEGNESPSIFTDVCFDVTGVGAFNRFIAEGYLAPLVPKSTSAKIDVSQVKIRGGEFVESELQAAVNREEVTIAAIEECLQVADDRNHWLVFAAGVEHADATCRLLRLFGVSAVSIHSGMSTEARDEAIKGFKSGKYRAAVNNNVLTTGFDFPAIDLIVVLRPTMSAVLWVQMLGRGTRPYPGKKNCLVLDFAANTKRLGPINDPVIPKRKGEKGSGDAPVKECPRCGTYVHTRTVICDVMLNETTTCGYEFKFDCKLTQGASTEELIRRDDPITKWYVVDHITYTRHQKGDKPPSMKVTYYSNYDRFNEWVCVQHVGFALHKAKEWWKANGIPPIPETVEEALSRTAELRQPSKILVHVNADYPRILNYSYDPLSEDEKNSDLDEDIPF